VSCVRSLCVVVLALAVCLALSAPAAALNVGDKAPPFELKDADGKAVKLDDFAGKPVVITLFLEGNGKDDAAYLDVVNWRADEVWAKVLDAVALAIKPGAPDQVKAWRDEVLKDTKQVVVLADPDGKYADAVGAKGKPATLVLDKEHTVNWLYVGESESDRPSIDIVTAELAKAIKPPDVAKTTFGELKKDAEGKPFFTSEFYELFILPPSGYILGKDKITEGIPLYHEIAEITLEDGSVIAQALPGKTNNTAIMWAGTDFDSVIVYTAGALIDENGKPTKAGFFKKIHLRETEIEFFTFISAPPSVPAKSAQNKWNVPKEYSTFGNIPEPITDHVHGKAWFVNSVITGG